MNKRNIYKISQHTCFNPNKTMKQFSVCQESLQINSNKTQTFWQASSLRQLPEHCLLPEERFLSLSIASLFLTYHIWLKTSTWRKKGINNVSVKDVRHCRPFTPKSRPKQWSLYWDSFVCSKHMQRFTCQLGFFWNKTKNAFHKMPLTLWEGVKGKQCKGKLLISGGKFFHACVIHPCVRMNRVI